MALKQVPVIDAAEATQSINYNEADGGLNQVVELAGGVTNDLRAGGQGVRVYQHTGSVAGGATAPVYSAELGRGFDIIALEFTASTPTHLRLALQVHNKIGSLNSYSLPRADGAGAVIITHSNVEEQSSSLFENIKYEDGKYKMALRPGVVLRFPNGGSVEVVNTDAATARNCVLMVVVLERTLP